MSDFYNKNSWSFYSYKHCNDCPSYIINQSDYTQINHKHLNNIFLCDNYLALIQYHFPISN